jgi:hypothetical protein
MVLEVESFEGDIVEDTKKPKGYSEAHIKKVSGRMRAHIPEGANANLRIRGKTFKIANYRERPGHTAGARIEGDGVVIKLDSSNTTNAIDLNIFHFRAKV